MYYRIVRQGCVHLESKSVDSTYLEAEIDAIEYQLGQLPGFEFIPSKPTQLQILKHFVKTVEVDPLSLCYEFRRATIEAQENGQKSGANLDR